VSDLDFVMMYPCAECGDDVDSSECYEDMGVLMHAMGVTGQAEPHETGHGTEDLKKVYLLADPLPAPRTPDIRPLVVRDVSAYLVDQLGITPEEATKRANKILDDGLRQMGLST